MRKIESPMVNQYSKDDIVRGLRDVGVAKGSDVFIHSNLGFFGRMVGAGKAEDYCKCFKDAIFEVIGDGTLIVPTYSRSFFLKQVFDKRTSTGFCGLFSEYIRTDSLSLRSSDPNFSVAAIGRDAVFFTSYPSTYSYGGDCFWKRFLDRNGIICNFNLDAGSSLVHYIEREQKVNYRFDKHFEGRIVVGGKEQPAVYSHFVYDVDQCHMKPNFAFFMSEAEKMNMVKKANLGRGQIVSISAQDTRNVVIAGLKRDPYFLMEKV
jgi:aminoglycoside 3-N-acetyltransferase